MELDLSSYASKTDLKNVTHVDVSSFASKANLASLKTEVDKLDIAKLTPVPDDLAKLSNVVKNDVVKKTEYDKLAEKVDNIDTTGFALKNTYDTDKSGLENKISDAKKKNPDPSDLTKKTYLNAKITEIESVIPSITGLAINSALTAVENEILDVSSLVKKTDYDTKVSEIEKKITDHDHDKCITTPESNKPTTENFKARLKQGDLVTKTDFDTKLQALNKKITSNKTKHLLIENELNKIKTFDPSYFRGKNHFEEDGAQNYLGLQPMHRYFKSGSGNYIYIFGNLKVCMMK